MVLSFLGFLFLAHVSRHKAEEPSNLKVATVTDKKQLKVKLPFLS
jgi:hypothetical protein